MNHTPETTCLSRSRSWRIPAAASIVVLLAAGCGSGDSSDTASPKASAGQKAGSDDATTTTAATDPGKGDKANEENGDACDIVSDEVAADVLGIKIERREPHTDPSNNGVSCIKGTERTNDLANGAYVSAAIIPGAGAQLVDDATAQKGSELVKGLGDRAVFLPDAGVIFIADGADAVQVQVVKGGKPAGQKDVVTVAEDVEGRR